MHQGYQRNLAWEDIQRIKSEIIRELALNQQPYTNSHNQTNVHAHYQFSPDSQKPDTTIKWPRLPNLPNVNFLYGLGAVGLMALLLPSSGRSIESLVTTTLEDGRELINKANALMVRTKEGVEDLIAEASLENLKNQFNP